MSTELEAIYDQYMSSLQKNLEYVILKQKTINSENLMIVFIINKFLEIKKVIYHIQVKCGMTENLQLKICKTCKRKISGYGKQFETRWYLHEHEMEHKKNIEK